MGLTDFNYPLQTLNPMTGSMNFDPLAYGLTMQDIKDSASDALKTSFTGGNISITDNLIEEVRDLSRRKYSTVIMPENMDDKASGLYLNNERMGFWDRPSGSWAAYIDSTGNFELRHPTISDSSLTWNSALGTLTIQGDITGSTITGSTFKTSSGPTRIEISDDEIRGYDYNILVSTIKPGAFSDGTPSGTESGVQITGNLSVSGFSNMKTIYMPTGNIDLRDGYIRGIEPGSLASAIYGRKVTRETGYYCVEAKRDLGVGVLEGSNARIYLGFQGAYLYNDTGTLHWVDGLGNDWTIDKHL